jgi:hypothetical protein
MLGYNHSTEILRCTYENYLKPIRTHANCNVQASLAIHVLGLADRKLITDAFLNYAAEQSKHPGVTFSLETSLRIYPYVSAPWAHLLRV